MSWIYGFKLLSECYKDGELFNIDMHYYNFLTNPAATSQFSYDILAILYLLCITERILYLIDDTTMILRVADTWL